MPTPATMAPMVSLDGEPRRSARHLVLDAQGRHLCPRWPDPTPVEHLLDRRPAAFEPRLDAAVGHVAHPTGHAAGAGSLSTGVPVEHPLDATAHEDVDGDQLLRRLATSVNHGVTLGVAP